jgi:hypothetical protein
MRAETESREEKGEILACFYQAGSILGPIIFMIVHFCRILDGASREFIKQIAWQIGYDTPDRAEKAGLIISKKWIDAGKP